MKKTNKIVLPNLDEASIIALNVATNIKPKLSANEEAFFLAGFLECIKYLSKQG